MSKIFVTGVNGFVGGHLTRELVGAGWDVMGVGYDQQPTDEIKNLVSQYIRCDLTDYEQVAKLPLENVSAVINLAGLAAVGQSFENPELYMRVNVGVLATICKRVKKLGRKDLRIVAISSGAVYSSDQAMPLTEESQTTPHSSPYAASKLAMEDEAKNFRSEGYDCVVARPFNHIGPGQAEGFLLPDLYKKIEESGGSEVRVGNLETKRDYTDVRDVARAYTALVTADRLTYDVYNVCSGKSVSGEEILKMLRQQTSNPDLRTVVDNELFRPSDAPVLYGSNERIRKDTGWAPTIPLEQTIQDFLEAHKRNS